MWVLIVVVLLALVGASLFVVISLLGNEPPIRVRNGSMEVVLAQGEWKDDGDAWTPSEGKSGKGFTVTVVSANGHACQNGQTGSGKEAWILYSGKTEFSFRFAGLFNPKTKVRPKNKLDEGDSSNAAARPAGRPGLYHRRRNEGWREHVELYLHEP